jgi:hypothetical protein
MPRRNQDRPHTSAKGDLQIWSRVLEKKRRACAAKSEEELKSIFKDVQQVHGNNDNNDLNLNSTRLEELLTRHFQTASNPNVSPEQRRISWTLVRNVLHRIDGKPLVEPVVAAARTSAEDEVAVAASASASSQAAARKPTAGAAAAAAAARIATSTVAAAPPARNSSNGAAKKTATTTLANSSASASTSNSWSQKTGLTASLLANLQATEKQLLTLTTAATTTTRPLPPNVNNGNVQPPVPPPVSQRTSNVVAVTTLEKQQTARKRSPPLLPSYDHRARSNSNSLSASSASTNNSKSKNNSSTTTAPSTLASRLQATRVVGQSSHSPSVPSHPRHALTSRIMPKSPNDANSNIDKDCGSDMDISDSETTLPKITTQVGQQRLAAAAAKNKPALKNGNGHSAATATRQAFAPPPDEAPTQQPSPPKRQLVVFPKVASEWDPVSATPKIAGATEEVKFNPDALLQYTNSPFSGALHPRHAVTARFRKQIPSLDMSRDVGRRMAVWDPYWRTERILACGLSSPVDATHFRPQPGNTTNMPMLAPQTVVSCSFNLTPELMKLLLVKGNNDQDWGNKDLPPARDGESRLILRMLPLQAQTKKRADCHLWPKGTFCVINGGNAQRLYQRKQQSHEHTKWLGMCKHLDMTSLILAQPNNRTSQTTTTTHTMELACIDAERYFFCISICTFQNADTITSALLNPMEGTQPYLQKLTLEESIHKALALITQPIIMDDLMSGDEATNHNAPPEDVGKLVFTLTCPLSKALMKIPVRGRCCKHWQVCKHILCPCWLYP